ncbi:MAG TPA: type II secretion system protein GspK [Rhodanobacteraceae bacterium]|nr:type II secretion system protein GspK [Rhodanobacteraceae bacterium]
MNPVRRQRGVAFLVVLWVVALVAVLLGSFAVIARTENLQARHLLDSTRARYAAEAGINLAAWALRLPDMQARWVPDGRPYSFDFGGATVKVQVNDESGKIDINVANDDQLVRLFESVGMDIDQAGIMAARVNDWRDPDDLTSLNGAEKADYKRAGLSYAPTNGPFTTVGELQQVLGMDYSLYRKLEPAITVYSGSGQPNPMYANQQALLAMQGMTGDIAQQLIELRQQIPPGTQGGLSGLTLPDGTPLIASGGGVTYSVKSQATLPNGATTTLDVTIRLGGMNPSARPFVIMRWREGDRS